VTSPGLSALPLAYQPSYETPEDDEGQTVQELVETMHKISAKAHEDKGHAYRSVHAKSHGVLRAEVQVLDGMPKTLVQGSFAMPGNYPAMLRLSTTPGDLMDDRVLAPRAVALKMVGVQGERVSGAQGQVTQDFLMVNAPAFSAPTAKKFLTNLKLLAATTDKAEGLKKVLPATLRGLESLIEKAGRESPTLVSMGAHAMTHILGETFYTQVSVLYGPYMAKLSLAPVSSELLALAGEPLDIDRTPDPIRRSAIGHFERHGGIWELRVQLCTDLEKMPIEDASVPWSEDLSPYVAVARVVAKPQNAWSKARVAAVDDGMSFDPWHALAAHRPIGSIMPVGRAAYDMGSRFRSRHNAMKVVEPDSLESLPD
jgi:hypothetical protein